MQGTIGALLYLRFVSLRNAALSRLRRLRQPKYLVGAIVGAAYVYFAFVRQTRRDFGRNIAVATDGMSGEAVHIALIVMAVLFSLGVLLCWVWPRSRAALRFSEAEIAFLFPAPIARRSLIHYRLANLQFRLLITALIIAAISVTWSFLQSNFAVRVAGWWLIFATLSLHTMGSSFVITRLLDRGVTSLRRQLWIAGAALAVLSVAAATVWQELHLPGPADIADLAAFTAYVASLFDTGFLYWLLLPGKWVVQPLLAPNLSSFAATLGPALLVYAVHYWWVLRTEVSFEEGSIAKAQRRAARLATLRGGKLTSGGKPKARRAPFDVSKTKRPEFAFLWKNLLSTADYLRPRTAVVAAGLLTAVCLWLNSRPDYNALRFVVAAVAVFVAAYMVVLGPQFARQDLRRDLGNTDILKTYPLRGWQVVLGQLLTPLAIVTVLTWLALLVAALTGHSERLPVLTPALMTGGAVYIALAVPPLVALQLVVVNGAAVLFPAWVQASGDRSVQGLEVMGQRIFFLAGQLFLTALALLPAVLVGGLLWFALQWLTGDIVAIAAGGIAVLGVLVAEVGLGIAWLGARFDNFDLAHELRA
jgi:ABC-2 type transport system permease protein